MKNNMIEFRDIITIAQDCSRYVDAVRVGGVGSLYETHALEQLRYTLILISMKDKEVKESGEE